MSLSTKYSHLEIQSVLKLLSAFSFLFLFQNILDIENNILILEIVFLNNFYTCHQYLLVCDPMISSLINIYIY